MAHTGQARLSQEASVYSALLAWMQRRSSCGAEECPEWLASCCNGYAATTYAVLLHAMATPLWGSSVQQAPEDSSADGYHECLAENHQSPPGTTAIADAALWSRSNSGPALMELTSAEPLCKEAALESAFASYLQPLETLCYSFAC
mmetsp:Transcript_53895/g.128834  ORF Transcript_53895/g.128834 Transcript_53895/m.128834 type:complete len:146 (-) Transcript_53895:583-1020(-)